jgi:hypothetical protein
MPEPAGVASFVPSGAVRVLVLAHGFPWVDGSQSDSFLAEYAQAAVERWTTFAEAHQAMAIQPGAQFAARYLVAHPERLEEVILSVPGAYPFPDPALVGSRDTVPQPPEPGQRGSTRIERATAWVDSMHRHAEASDRTPTIRLVQAEGLDHDEAAMVMPAQEILARKWTTGRGPACRLRHHGGHVHELSVSPNSRWTHADLTAGRET